MQVLLAVMKRMDTLIFHFLINPPADSVSEGGSSQDAAGAFSPTPESPAHNDSGSLPHTVMHDPLNPNMPMLDDSMLFFTRGVLTFGTGMNLKMACTRLAGIRKVVVLDVLCACTAEGLFRSCSPCSCSEGLRMS